MLLPTPSSTTKPRRAHFGHRVVVERIASIGARRNPNFHRVSSVTTYESLENRCQSRWIQISLDSLASEPTVDSVGDCLPSRLKHHVVAHLGEKLGVDAVGTGNV